MQKHLEVMDEDIRVHFVNGMPLEKTISQSKLRKQTSYVTHSELPLARPFILLQE